MVEDGPRAVALGYPAGVSEPSATLVRTSNPVKLSWTALGFAMAFPTALTLAYFVLLAGRQQAQVQTVYTLGKVVQFGFPLAWTAWCTGRFPRPSLPGRRGAGVGLAFGIAVLAGALALHTTLLAVAGGLDGGVVQAKVAAFGVTSPRRFLALGAFYSLFHSAAEEYYWRWFVFGALRRAVRASTAVAVSSAAFAAHHLIILGTFFGWTSPWTPALTLAVAVGGAFWAWLYHRSGSLIGPWISHMLVDAAIFAVGYQLAF
jgi:membrane protease YdiL (CAAX protease family)